jgi:ubiquinone/menaquinone biosynthesis C-methylase UbiE
MSDQRARSFGAIAEQYDAFRPGPPSEAAALLGDLRALKVLEVAAGTGLWSRFLVELGAELTVVEPDDEMRAVLERQSPQVRSLVGTAESLPAADASFDVVVVSSAWHWFSQPEATHEMARVLRGGGRLFVLWNGFSKDVAWVDELARLRNSEGDPQIRPRGWTAAELAGDLFHDVTDVIIDWTWRRSTEEMVSLFGTYSGVIVRSDEERRSINHTLRSRLAELTLNDVLDVPMTLRGTSATRSAR